MNQVKANRRDEGVLQRGAYRSNHRLKNKSTHIVWTDGLKHVFQLVRKTFNVGFRRLALSEISVRVAGRHQTDIVGDDIHEWLFPSFQVAYRQSGQGTSMPRALPRYESVTRSLGVNFEPILSGKFHGGFHRLRSCSVSEITYIIVFIYFTKSSASS